MGNGMNNADVVWPLNDVELEMALVILGSLRGITLIENPINQICEVRQNGELLLRHRKPYCVAFLMGTFWGMTTEASQ